MVITGVHMHVKVERCSEKVPIEYKNSFEREACKWLWRIFQLNYSRGAVPTRELRGQSIFVESFIYHTK